MIPESWKFWTDNLGGRVATSQIRASRRLHNTWLHDVTDRMKLRRVAIAKDMGLDPDHVENYPTHGDTIVHRGIPGWVLPALATLGVAAWLGSKYLDKPAAPEPQVITQPGEVWESDVEMIVE